MICFYSTGQLLWNKRNSEWVLRTGEVKQGSLILVNEQCGNIELRLPLRGLSLRPSNIPRSFCLTEAEGLRLLMFQVQVDKNHNLSYLT
ncbi:hypothetical protein Phum_PHUM127780 [Pediculus humanus corporis]|uniref:Uncharacterized protein n=1 Tax=Pediculus humanus subsp. corporis TaxID=121224 RepID=E0VE19_PEDHC|nr:uncharacterized protein Phum_PHUM127780 [Pediculus humanus corporis]EEB11625.1 hypothetical protein Phum_PHUM127780 [Pediculus humanus corporis]